MSSGPAKAADDADDYLRLCREFNERPVREHWGVDYFSDHAYYLKAKSRGEEFVCGEVSLSDEDRAVEVTVDWLRANGHAEAAASLAATTSSGTVLSQVHLVRDQAALDVVMAAQPKVRIWSGDRAAWWRANGAGYVNSRIGAGLYGWLDAWARTRLCDPSKGIMYEVVL